MRTTFINSLVEEAAKDEKIWLLNADLGFSVLEPFAERFPERYLNVGVSEQNMIGVAAGLAATGAKVFVYSIANFPTQRCLEQIRVDVCYHDLHVVVVAVGGGFAYGSQGYTHHAIEDLAVMRSLPGMRVGTPGDPVETHALVQTFCAQPGPAYLRLGRNGEVPQHTEDLAVPVSDPIVMRDGDDILMLSVGGILENSIQASELLAGKGINAKVLSVPVLKPLDADLILSHAKGKALVVTIEEHSLIGGLRDAIAPILAEAGNMPRLLGLGVQDGATKGVILGQESMRSHCGIDPPSIAVRVEKALSL